VSTTAATLQDIASVDEFLNVAAIETVPLFEHLSFDFLKTTTCSPPRSGGEHGSISRQISSVASSTAITRMSTAHVQSHENSKTAFVWYYCGLNKPPSRDTIDRFLTDLEHVIDDVFNQLVEQAAVRGLLDVTYSIDSTHVEAINLVTTQPRGTTIQRLKSTTTASAVQSSQPVQKSRLRRSSHRPNKRTKADGDARHP